LATGGHTIEVQAAGTATRSDTISVNVVGTPPTNRAPVASNDSYSTPSGATLDVAAPGVLGNDSDPDGDVLAASRVAGPSNGTLALNRTARSPTSRQRLQRRRQLHVPGDRWRGQFEYGHRVADHHARQTTEVTITTATYTRKTKLLKVEATSTKAPTATSPCSTISQRWASRCRITPRPGDTRTRRRSRPRRRRSR